MTYFGEFLIWGYFWFIICEVRVDQRKLRTSLASALLEVGEIR